MYAIGIILLISPLSMANLSAQHIKTIKDAAKKLTGVKRRAFQAQVAIDYLNSKPHLADKTFGRDRRTVALGLNELRTGLVCFDDFKARGNKKTETKYRNWKSTSLLWPSLTPAWPQVSDDV